MAKQTNWNCDGCDKREITDGDEHLPDRWEAVVIKLDGVGPPPHQSVIYADLCLSCQRQLLDQANPRQWPRCRALPTPPTAA